VTERLRLFRLVCAAVAYAHEQQVIHRDIKPGNILVTEDGTPKLLDFGIAKILNPDLAFDTIDPTLTAMRMMTPEYASPEQARGEQVTDATDQYSLGVLLYELLTGQRPHQLRNRAPHEIARIIGEEEPERPSDDEEGQVSKLNQNNKHSYNQPRRSQRFAEERTIMTLLCVPLRPLRLNVRYQCCLVRFRAVFTLAFGLIERG
jgi:serine/threonine protein kinase